MYFESRVLPRLQTGPSRTIDSYNRHLPQCEPLSTSESESEPRSPDMQSPPHNMIITSMSGQDFMPIMTTQHQNSSQQIYNFNGQQINPISIQNIQGHPIQIHSSQLQNTTSMSMQNQCAISNNGVQMQQLNQPIQNMIINATNGQQQQLFAQPLQNIGQQIFPIQNLQQSQFGGMEIQNKTHQQRMNSTPQTITLPNGINIQTSQPIMHQQQPQIITFSQASNGQPQIVITPTSSTQQNVSNFTATTRTIQQSPYKNQLILPQPDNKSPSKRNMMPKIMPQSHGVRAKGRTVSTMNKPIQIKRTIVKNEPKPMMFNQSLPLIRPMNNGTNVVIQQNPGSQPIIVQQLGGNQNNLVQYVTGNQNSMQYIAMPTNGGDFKQQQTQYLTPNPLVPGTFQLQTADNGNLLLANSTGGLQMLPNGTLQLVQPQQPQVIGTIIQQQPNGQYGMMSAEQMVLSHTPTLEMMTNPANGCMMLTSQPMYYGLETIVQNTVMSSQQFVSTAMQGVLSQNASFSATTTQVFQASKIEPIMEMPTGYVVLNNNETIMQTQPTQQSGILSANVLQQGVPQISQIQPHQMQQIQQQLQSQTQQQQQQQQSSSSTWQFVDDKSTIQLLPQHQQQQQPHQQQHHSNSITIQSQPQPSVRPNQSPKPVVKSAPIVVTKVQPQNKILANQIQQHLATDAKLNQNILPKPENVITSYNQFIMQPSTSKYSTTMSNYQQQKSITVTTSSSSPQMPIHPIPRKYNAIKQPTTKIAAAIVRPKVITRPVMSSKVQPTHQKTSKMMTITPATQTSSSIVIPPNPIIVPLYEPVTETPTTTTPSSLSIPSENPLNATSFEISPSSIEYLSASFNQQQQQQPTFAKNQINIEPTNQLSTNQTNSQKSIPTATYFPNQQQQSQQQQQQYNPSTSQSQLITLPSSASIQLPTAPYAPTYSNGIPTNVVNPIQQYNYTNTRPTNRVLPMQTVQQKMNNFPQTPPEPKSVDVTTKKIITVDTSKLSPIIEQELSPNQLVIVEKEDDGPCSVDGFDQDDDLNMEIDKIIESKSNQLSPDQRDSQTPSDSDELFNKLKGEHDSLLSREDSNSERTSPDVKDKICEILVNLENEDCTKNVPDTDSDMFSMNEADQQTMSCKSEPEQNKENIVPVVSNDTSMMKYQKSAFREQQPLTKSTGPKMLYEIQSQDGFTYKSTSISEIWEKVFETVQVARNAHGLTALPEGPLADMCGLQMLGLKTNALKYLLEQLPGVEKCTKYQPKYHKKPQSTISGAASSGYCSDTEELKENVIYGAAIRNCTEFANIANSLLLLG